MMKPIYDVPSKIIPVLEYTAEEKARALAEVETKNVREWGEHQLRQWLRVCPLIYDHTLDFSKLSPGNHGKIKSIVEWNQFPRGLFLVGPTGQGKTRAVWAALKRRWLEGKTVRCKSSFQMAQDAVASMTDHDRAKSIMNQYVSPDILFLDDVGKRLTSSACQFLFEVIERRTNSDKTLACTSNDTMSTLEQGIGDSTMAGPIIRRIEEFCDLEVLL